MKTKFFAAVVAALFSTVLFAQKMTHDAGHTTFGVRGGVNFFTITGKNTNGDKFNNDIRTGFQAGVNAEIPVGTGSYLQPGLLYSQKGDKVQGGGKVRLSYLEIPVNFIYKPILGTGRMLLGFGPYVGFGISGNVETSSGIESDVEFTKKFDNNISKSQFRGIDGGANFLAGYEFSNAVSFQINAQLGLAELTPKNIGVSSEYKSNNTGFGISVGYRF